MAGDAGAEGAGGSRVQKGGWLVGGLGSKNQSGLGGGRE